MAIINNFSSGVAGGSYAPNTYTELGAAIGKVALQVIKGIETKNPIDVFEKGEIGSGDTVENAVVKLVEASAYDPQGETTLDRDTTAKLAVEYFKNWERHAYKTTVDMSLLRKIMNGGSGSEDVATKLVAALGNSSINDKFQSFKALLAWGSTVGSKGEDDTALVSLGNIAKSGTATDYKGILKAIKNAVKGMTFVNTSYNKGGLKRSTALDDIYIIMPYELRNALDVDELAGVFNLEKTEIGRKIIEIDSTDKKIYVVDKNAILHYRRLYEMQDQKNAEGLFWNYYLHVEDMFGISTLFDGAFITYA